MTVLLVQNNLKDAVMTRITLTLLSLVLFAAQAGAAPITTLFGSGLDSSGNQLAPGATDLDYIVLETNTSAEVVSSALATKAYLANDAGSQWIWEDVAGYPDYVDRTFRTTFDLTGLDPTTAVIDGLWGVDNLGEGILLNGVSTGYSLPTYGYANFENLYPFVIDSGFQSGINTLDFVVRNEDLIGGFRTQLSGTANPIPVVGGVITTTVPEPSSLLLLSLGLATVALRRLRR